MQNSLDIKSLFCFSRLDNISVVAGWWKCSSQLLSHLLMSDTRGTDSGTYLPTLPRYLGRYLMECGRDAILNWTKTWSHHFIGPLICGSANILVSHRARWNKELRPKVAWGKLLKIDIAQNKKAVVTRLPSSLVRSTVHIIYHHPSHRTSKKSVADQLTTVRQFLPSRKTKKKNQHRALFFLPL